MKTFILLSEKGFVHIKEGQKTFNYFPIKRTYVTIRKDNKILFEKKGDYSPNKQSLINISDIDSNSYPPIDKTNTNTLETSLRQYFENVVNENTSSSNSEIIGREEFEDFITFVIENFENTEKCFKELAKINLLASV